MNSEAKSLLGLSNSRRLEFLQSGEFSDCTIRIRPSSDLSPIKDYKLHKEILGSASDVIKAMFGGGFKEAKMGPDEPIPLIGVEPLVFESVLRFVYGGDFQLESVAFAIKIYKFADQWQIKTLMEKLDELFKYVDAAEIFQVFELFTLLQKERAFFWCKYQSSLAKDTEKALASEHWLNLSSENVVNFLLSGSKNVLEGQLVVSVLQWGKFQVEADGGDPQDGQTLRAKILPALKQIRFAVVDPKNFAKLCHRELGAAFSVGEKLAIFKAMAGNADLLPTDFCRSKLDRSPRSSGSIQLNFVDCGTEVTAHKGAEHTALLTFKINKRATISQARTHRSNCF